MSTMCMDPCSCPILRMTDYGGKRMQMNLQFCVSGPVSLLPTSIPAKTQ